MAHNGLKLVGGQAECAADHCLTHRFTEGDLNGDLIRLLA